MPNNPIGPGPKAGRNYRVEVMVYDVYTTEAVVGFSATAKREQLSPTKFDPDGSMVYGPVEIELVGEFIQVNTQGGGK